MKRGASAAPLERVKAIQAQLAASTDLNPVVELQEIVRSLHKQLVDGDEDRSHLKALTLAVRVVSQSFVALCASGTLDVAHVSDAGRLALGEASADPAAQVARWLKEQWNTFIDLVHETLLCSPVSSVRLAALEVSMALESAASEALASGEAGKHAGKWSTSPFRLLVRTLLFRDVAEDVIDAFAESYLEVYDDVRYSFCREVSRILRAIPDASAVNQHVRSRARTLLARITAIPTKESHLNNFLVPHLAKAPPKKKAKKSAKPKFGEDGEESDDETLKEAEESVPMFSDTDEEMDEEPSAPVSGRGRRSRQRGKGLRESMHGLAAQRQAFAAAWLSLLLPASHVDASGATVVHGGTFSLAETHDTLVRLHAQILPHLPKPNMLHDFLVDCLDARGTTALLALNGLFTLIVSHNLDYPAFYTRLYALLDASVMHTKYRSRFMRMLDTFLGSSHLPVAIVASFLKRLSRLSLRATPAAIVEIVPFVWNLLKRHPSCMPMIHREWDGDHLAVGPSGLQDGFDAREPNPLHTGALESSLWEIASFGAFRLSQTQQQRGGDGGGDTHYLGAVTTFASILAEPFTQQRYVLEEFLDTTYGTLFDNEARKTLQHKEKAKRRAPPATEPLDVTLAVPPMLPGKSGNVDVAIRRETRKRLRHYAFPTQDKEELDEARRATMSYDAVAELWTMA